MCTLSASPVRRRNRRGLLLWLLLAIGGTTPVQAQLQDTPSSARTPQEAARERIQSAKAELDGWLARLAPERELPAKQKKWLRERVRTITDALDWVPAEIVPAATTLLDLASYRISRFPESSYFVGGEARFFVRDVGLRALQLIQADGGDAELTDWLTRGVLADRRLNSVNRRWLALYFLLRSENELLDRILVRVAADRDDALSNKVLSLLPSRSSTIVDKFLVARLKQPRMLGTPHPYNLLRERLQLGTLDSLAANHLINHVKGLLLSHDWRDASRGIELCRDMSPRRATPMLLEGLYTWKKRSERESGNARRMTWDIVGVLRRISGRNIGDTPQNWMTWWKAVRSDPSQLRSARDKPPKQLESTAEFYGLRPTSSRLTFIIDHSSSMGSNFMGQRIDRYKQAVDQLLNFLHAAGEETMFNVILFDSAPLTSTPHLIRASPRNLERAQRALLSRTPNGSTFLRGAVESALKLDRQGEVDPAKVDIDTIVVLCDGQTDSGRSWVRPLLERVNDDLRIVFHCVQIGAKSDGTLEDLAEFSGGTFIFIPE